MESASRRCLRDSSTKCGKKRRPRTGFPSRLRSSLEKASPSRVRQIRNRLRSPRKDAKPRARTGALERTARLEGNVLDRLEVRRAKLGRGEKPRLDEHPRALLNLGLDLDLPLVGL